jgi:hypothetical protein
MFSDFCCCHSPRAHGITAQDGKKTKAATLSFTDTALKRLSETHRNTSLTPLTSKVFDFLEKYSNNVVDGTYSLRQRGCGNGIGTKGQRRSLSY